MSLSIWAYLSVTMLITGYTVSFLNTQRVRLSWTGTVALYSWIFINGLLVDGSSLQTSTAKTLDVDVNDPFAVEIHECTASETPFAINTDLRRMPTFWWSQQAGAISYSVYRTPSAPGGVEAFFASRPIDPTADHIEYRAPIDLRQDNFGVWNLWRIEAVNGRGVETVRAPFPELVQGLPPPPKSITVTGAANVFTLAVGT